MSIPFTDIRQRVFLLLVCILTSYAKSYSYYPVNRDQVKLLHDGHAIILLLPNQDPDPTEG